VALEPRGRRLGPTTLESLIRACPRFHDGLCDRPAVKLANDSVKWQRITGLNGLHGPGVLSTSTNTRTTFYVV